jgi:3-phosphoshikimate 1-carboxyvinyltransferase
MKETIINLNFRNQNPVGKLVVSGSKSESNRWLILQQLFSNITIHNLSDAEDTQLLQKALDDNFNEIDIHHAGTAMRFLTAFYAIQEGREVVLTGSDRMKNRPIKLLVDALKSLGAEITYVEKDGFPPLSIKGKKLTKNEVTIAGNISSQYISALLLIAPSFTNGLTINFKTEITSKPYLEMTVKQLKELGVEVLWVKNQLIVSPFNLQNKNKKEVIVESDWSSASYFYSLVALSKHGEVTLSSYQKESKQGDAELSKLYELLGVKTTFLKNQIQLKKEGNFDVPSEIKLNLIKTPDIAQTIAVTCLGLGVKCYLTGLHTLKIKETDRLSALKNELEKLGAKVEITDDSLQMYSLAILKEEVMIETYNDHRMAMAFAPLALKIPIQIQDKNVVVKSYPNFWEDYFSLFI